MAIEESVKCSESRSTKYLTVHEQESWDRIFYYCAKAEIQHVIRYKGHTEDNSLHIICQIVSYRFLSLFIIFSHFSMNL